MSPLKKKFLAPQKKNCNSFSPEIINISQDSKKINEKKKINFKYKYQSSQNFKQFKIHLVSAENLKDLDGKKDMNGYFDKKRKSDMTSLKSNYLLK